MCRLDDGPAIKCEGYVSLDANLHIKAERPRQQGEYVMKLAKFVMGLLLAALCFIPKQASAAPAYGCSIAEIFECTPVAGCQRVSGQQANLPPFVTLDVRQRRLFSGLSAGRGCLIRGMPMRMKMCSSSMEGTSS
jgi:hypothetical protein